DRLGHDRDQKAAMPARLEAEAGAEIVEMLLEPPPLVGDRAPRQSPEAAREQPHPDPCRVEVDGPDDAIGSHEHLQMRAMRLHPSRPVKIWDPGSGLTIRHRGGADRTCRWKCINVRPDPKGGT